MNEKFYTYKGYPLVRCGNIIYYGYMSDPFVTQITITSSEKSNGLDMTKKVKIVLMSTDPQADPLKACKRNSTFECGLYEALDTAHFWLEKELTN